MVKKNLCLISMFCLVIGCSDHSIKRSVNNENTDKNNTSQTDFATTTKGKPLPAVKATFTQEGSYFIKTTSGETIMLDGPSNCINIADANALAAFGYADNSIVKTYTEHPDEDDIRKFYALVEANFNISEMSRDSGSYNDKVFSSMKRGYQYENKKYTLSLGSFEEFPLEGSSDLEGTAATWTTGDHRVYVEGFTTNANGETLIQLDRYGSSFYMTEQQFNKALLHETYNPIKTIYVFSRKK